MSFPNAPPIFPLLSWSRIPIAYLLEVLKSSCLPGRRSINMSTLRRLSSVHQHLLWSKHATRHCTFASYEYNCKSVSSEWMSNSSKAWRYSSLDGLLIISWDCWLLVSSEWMSNSAKGWRCSCLDGLFLFILKSQSNPFVSIATRSRFNKWLSPRLLNRRHKPRVVYRHVDRILRTMCWCMTWRPGGILRNLGVLSPSSGRNSRWNSHRNLRSSNNHRRRREDSSPENRRGRLKWSPLNRQTHHPE